VTLRRVHLAHDVGHLEGARIIDALLLLLGQLSLLVLLLQHLVAQVIRAHHLLDLTEVLQHLQSRYLLVFSAETRVVKTRIHEVMLLWLVILTLRLRTFRLGPDSTV